MSTIDTCTLVIEYNHGKPGLSLGSVWLFNGDGTPDLEKSATLSALPGWFKIAGPIDHEVARSIHASLKMFFQQSGVAVIDEGVAD